MVVHHSSPTCVFLLHLFRLHVGIPGRDGILYGSLGHGKLIDFTHIHLRFFENGANSRQVVIGHSFSNGGKLRSYSCSRSTMFMFISSASFSTPSIGSSISASHSSGVAASYAFSMTLATFLSLGNGSYFTLAILLGTCHPDLGGFQTKHSVPLDIGRMYERHAP